MKRILIVGVLGLALASCGSSLSGTPTPAPAPAATTATTAAADTPFATAWVNDPGGSGRCLLVNRSSGALIAASCYANSNR